MRRFLAASLIGLVACTASSAGDDGYSLSEWAIEGPATLGAGPSKISVVNTGEFPHTLVVTNASGEVVGATGVIEPGTSMALDLELEAGTYSFSCRIVSQKDDGTLSDHYERGMHQTVEVG